MQKAGGTYITRQSLEAPIRFLSSDELEGRGPATRGDQLTRLYLSTALEGLGYQPAFPNGQWQQPFAVVGIKAQMPATPANAVSLGQRLAEDLLSQGAAELMANERTARSLAAEGP